MEFKCPFCSSIVNAPNASPGDEIKCRSCGDVFRFSKTRIAAKPRRILSFILGALFGPLGITIACFITHGRGLVSAVLGFLTSAAAAAFLVFKVIAAL